MHLASHTYYSLRYGTLSPRQLVEAAQARGVETLALTDVNNTSAAGEFVRLCREAGIRPLLGIDFFRDGQRLYTGLARNADGFCALNRFLSVHSIQGRPLPTLASEWDWNPAEVAFIYPRLVKPIERFAGYEYLGVRPEHVHRLFSSPVRHHPDRLIAFSPVTFLDEEGWELHRLLRAIDLNTLLSKLQPTDHAPKTELFHPPAVLRDFYKLYPRLLENAGRLAESCEIELETGLHINRQTFTGSREGDYKLLEKLTLEGFKRRFPECSVAPDTESFRYRGQCSVGSKQLAVGRSDATRKPPHPSPDADSYRHGASPSSKGPRGLTNPTPSTLNSKLSTLHPTPYTRLHRELEVIREMDFCAYFLITWDIVRYAQSAGYHHVGRGSGANSLVAYCLGITDVDPLELDLYFERFINRNRPSPPDFDIDFSWDERDDVTDYIFKRYGWEYTALLATYSTFQFNAAVREVGKVFGLPKEEIDNFADELLRKMGTEDVRYWKREQGGRLLRSEEEPNRRHLPSDIHAQVLRFAKRLHGFPNHLSIHAGGVLISERPIFYHTALQMMPKGFPITHFDMHHAEDLGFHKFDVLSQRGLGHIKDAVDLIKLNQGKAVDIHDVAAIKKDERVRAQLRSGHCIGCFYIESPAMRGLLKKLRCDTYHHLVAASSIIRPGVAQSGMMKEYIRRFHAPNSFDYLHPVFKEHLGETFGVMVYQEDVMKIVHHFAGLGLDESDMLRRLMSGKKRQGDQFELLKRKYFDNCRRLGHPDALAKEVWRQIESFAGYSFCKAHSASYAVESFQSLYLKTYYPLEFMVAVINNFGGFYRTEYYFHEARMAGATIHAPCVNNSQYLTSLRNKDIYVGFIHLNGLERQTAAKIVHQRTVGGPFRSLADFISRVDIGASQLELLIRIGAFRFTGLSKGALLWEKNAVFNPREKFEASGLLFPDPHENYELPPLEEGPYDQAFDEIELLGFPLCSPFELLADASWAAEGITAADLSRSLGRYVTMIGYYVCRKDVRTVKKELMHFGTWLDRDGHFFDTVHFPNFIKNAPFRGRGIYRIEGRVVEEFGFCSLEVVKMEKLPFRKDERYGG
ncbi:MAG: DNA polymerase III subunit alpha [Saprospirales bacterium]|nr:DNA polymerase III subunit alpha [Saprospirales bacterium]